MKMVYFDLPSRPFSWASLGASDPNGFNMDDDAECMVRMRRLVVLRSLMEEIFVVMPG